VAKVTGRLSSAAASFALLNLAAWLAFWVWITGNAGRSWRVVRYRGGGEPVGCVPSVAGGANMKRSKP